MAKDHARLFMKNVPNEKDFILNTFINREKEIAIGKNYFSFEAPLNQIYAVHGFSRVGKSHIAMYLAEKFAVQYVMEYFYINSNTKETAFSMLCKLLDEIWKSVKSINNNDLKDSDREECLAFLISYLSDINKNLYSPAEKTSFKTSIQKSKNLSPKLVAKIPYFDLGFEVGGAIEKKTTIEESKEYAEPDLKRLHRYISICLPVLNHITSKKTLLLFDDLDLLDETVAGKEERDTLTTQLKSIAEIDDVIVMITCRNSFYTKRNKEMFDFINVTMMNKDQLKEIYSKRIAAFYDNGPVFDDTTLNSLADNFNGRVGDFLNECDMFFRWSTDKKLPLSENDLRKYHEYVIDELRRTPETKVPFSKIEEKVRQNKFTIVLNDINETEWSLLRIVAPGYEDGNYEVLPLFAKAILEKP